MRQIGRERGKDREVKEVRERERGCTHMHSWVWKAKMSWANWWGCGRKTRTFKSVEFVCLCYCTLYVALSVLFHVWTLIFQSFMFVLHVIILDVTKRFVRAREKSERWYHWHLINTIRKEKKTKTGTASCGSFVVAYCQPILPSTVYIWCWQAGLEVGQPNNTWQQQTSL